MFDSVWVGDSLLAKPRLESIALLSALAGVTRRMRLAVGCMATFVHRHPVLLAQQWASLDVLSEGRALLAVCLGGPDSANAAQAAEHAVMGMPPASASSGWRKASPFSASSSRAECQSCRTLLSVRQGRGLRRARSSTRARSGSRQPHRADVEGRSQRLQRPSSGLAPRGALRRRVDDQQALAGGVSPQFGIIQGMAREEGRDPGAIGSALYHNINVNEDRQAALTQSKAFLDAYYTAKF